MVRGDVRRRPGLELAEARRTGNDLIAVAIKSFGQWAMGRSGAAMGDRR